jgi:hypothetical protein
MGSNLTLAYAGLGAQVRRTRWFFDRIEYAGISIINAHPPVTFVVGHLLNTNIDRALM